MDAKRDLYQQLAVRNGRAFLTSLQALPEYKPASGINMRLLRVAVTVIDGPDIGFEDVDFVNLGDLADITARRAEGLRIKHASTTTPPAPTGKPGLRIVGGAA